MVNPALIISIAIATTNIIQCTAQYDDDGQLPPFDNQTNSGSSSENARQMTSGSRGNLTVDSEFQAGFGGIDQLGTAGEDTPIIHTEPLNYNRGGAAVLRLNPKFSTPSQCERFCEADETPKICYYHFTLEQYTVLGSACELCRPNGTSYAERESCQCVLADGFERGILTANRMIPGPTIQVCKNDRLVIDVENHIPGRSITIHWHGIFQYGSQYYDGVPFVTQCPILEGTTFRYQWTAGNAGTHFWHAHTGFDKMDGIHGSLIIREPIENEPNRDLYDVDSLDYVILIAEWDHQRSLERFPGLRNKSPGQVPDNILINGKGTFTDTTTNLTTVVPLEEFRVIPGTRYRFRIINAFGSACPIQINIEDHVMTVIAADGEPVKPAPVESIVSFSGERYDFVLEANQPTKAYWIQLRALGDCGIVRLQNLATLRYQGQGQSLSAAPTYDEGLLQGVTLNPVDGNCTEERVDAICVSHLRNAREIDSRLLQEEPDVKIYLPYRYFFYRTDEIYQPRTYNRYMVAGANIGGLTLIDEISYVPPKSPPLSQILPDEQFCNRSKIPEGCGENCECTHTLDIPLDSVVELVIVDEVQQANFSHPFHLHGYAFNVLSMGHSPDESVKKINLKHVMDLDSQGLMKRRFVEAPGKDTIAVPNNGYVVVRFISNNPGYWVLHCHIQNHLLIGMNVILKVGERSDLPPVPPGFPTCGDYIPPIDGLSTAYSSSTPNYRSFHGYSQNQNYGVNSRNLR